MNNTVTTPRYIELDALRGFAVMGILLMNIVGFAMPEMAYVSPAVHGGTDLPDTIVWALSFIFIDGKMRGLFTILFGASMMLVIERAQRHGENPAKVHFSRMFWLALFGLAHFFLLWAGDILFLYAAVGCIAYFLRGLNAEDLIRRALLIFTIGFLGYTLMFGSLLYMQYQASLPGASAGLIDEVADVIAGFESTASAITADIALHQSGFLPILLDKIRNDLFGPLVLLTYNLAETLPLMMIGMALYRNGFITGQWTAEAYRSWGIRLTVIGTAIVTAIAIYLIAGGFEILRMVNASYAWNWPSQMLMTTGYAALLIWLIRTFQNASWVVRIAAVGRAAFSNYLGTSLLMTFLFYGWGLGLYGSVGRAELYLFVLAAWVLMLIWSKPWLTRFRYGPLEWLWRSLARQRAQPMRLS
ncbi:DUF418 domain-containing protein [Sphingorhabdus sp. YGSMI21]|uniref:DUF418 domain-containing protein n=1 Tax=Sphingorhabdus sp. YGSMI21 TaxID=2077182 RepID=UPI000C1F757B|nr:DUF418 domain-containing protein [Sphingorhabdus sp. YGSMI21]ATW02634.1 hypothetical protein CHN51_03185 [Sphingorhabdus sp. YGSMI21]